MPCWQGENKAETTSEAGIGKTLPRAAGVVVDLLECCGEPLPVTRDQRLGQRGLGREVMVDTRLRDRQLGTDVGVGEAVVPANLHQRLSAVQDPFHCRRHAAISTF